MNDGTGHRVPYPQETRHNTSFQRIDPFQHRQAFLQRRLPKGKTMYLAYFAVTVVGHYVLALDAQIRWDIQNEWRNTLRTVCSYYTAHSDREYLKDPHYTQEEQYRTRWWPLYGKRPRQD